MTRGILGQRLRDAGLSKYELAAHELVLLEQPTVIADRLAELQELVQAVGVYLLP